MKKWFKKIILLLAILFINGLFFYSVKAASENKNINVQLTVPSSGGGCGSSCPPPPDTTFPTINDVLATPR